MALFFTGITIGVCHADHLFGLNANNINQGKISNARLVYSSVTLLGSRIPNSALDASSVTMLGSNPAVTNVVINSTFTLRIGYGGSVFLSTNGVCSFPGACFWTGASTYNVIDIQAGIMKNSTVSFTTLQIVESTGGINALPVHTPFRFPLLVISTALASSVGSGWSSPITTTVVLNAGRWVGVQSSTSPVSGALPEGFNILMNVWKKPYGGL